MINIYGSETHLREVPIYVKSRIVRDVIKCQMMSLLTLSIDIRQNGTFKEKKRYFR